MDTESNYPNEGPHLRATLGGRSEENLVRGKAPPKKKAGEVKYPFKGDMYEKKKNCRGRLGKTIGQSITTCAQKLKDRRHGAQAFEGK